MKIKLLEAHTFTFLLIVALTLLLFSACNEKKPAVGSEDDIYVIADSSEYYDLEGSLLTVFSKVIYTPQPEILFNLKRKNLSELDNLKVFKNIIIIAPLNSNSQTSKYINSILDPKVKQLVNEDSVTVINKYNLWADGQLVMFLTAPTLEKLNQSILKQSENLLHYFQKESDDRLFKSLYNPRYEKKDIEAKFLKDYGWMIYVQADYLLALNVPNDHFVWLRRAPGSDMERWIFIYWKDNASPEDLNRDSVYAIRNRLTKKFYRTSDNKSYVEISDDYITTKEVNFLGRYALMTQGLWRMDDKSMGGPFVNYVFYDTKTKRIYMLDGSIYAPKYYKKSLIQQVDVILRSFMTESELSKDKKQDILSYYPKQNEKQ
ncbi:DUF4837 family protein [Melioribacteraceae bacterium 4301-Me]|uniref:DUF4837 family protein n=1 Tax=Pyranulibacter aquaticus TaxID=3163344 RepID=UPI003598D2D3